MYITQVNQVALNWGNKTHVSKKIGIIKEELGKQLREYWNLILEDNWNSILEYNAWYYWNKIQKYWKTIRIDGSTAWEDGNKPRGKLDLNLKSVIRIVITLEIAKGELMYGRGICKNSEGYTWNKT